jgi:DNA topoisomerase-1
LIGKPEQGAPDEEVYVRVGRYGPFLEQGERRASIPDDLPPDELTLNAALEMLDKAARGDEPLGVCPETHKPVFLKQGRFGPYVQLGTPDDGEKPKNASLLKGMTPADVTLEVALKLLELPRQLGAHPEKKEPVVVHNGRFGPYVKCGDETRSLPSGSSPIDVSLEEALELLAQPKIHGGRAAPTEPIRVFENSPVTDQPVKLLAGRYGPYVTDGTTNASIPKNTEPEEVTFDQALKLLADRAAQAPKKKIAKGGGRTKKAPAKKTPKKATKKTTKKKAK